jgi:hypothetical protein
VIGTLDGFVDGAVAALLFAWLYNSFARRLSIRRSSIFRGETINRVLAREFHLKRFGSQMSSSTDIFSSSFCVPGPLRPPPNPH